MLTSVTLSPDEAAGGGGFLPDGETTMANSSGVSSGSGIDVSITFGCAGINMKLQRTQFVFTYSHFTPNIAGSNVDLLLPGDFSRLRILNLHFRACTFYSECGV